MFSPHNPASSPLIPRWPSDGADERRDNREPENGGRYEISDDEDEAIIRDHRRGASLDSRHQHRHRAPEDSRGLSPVAAAGMVSDGMILSGLSRSV